MNLPILNRDFTHPADNWYHIEPKGEFPNSGAGLVQVIDSEAVKNIATKFNAQAADPKFAGLLVDHEHFKHDAGKETRAYGWLTKLDARDDGLYGQIRWTTTGKAAVDGGDYRYFSTEYNRDDLEVLNKDTKKVRPKALSGLTLTNDPNNRGAKPITNRASVAEEPKQEHMKTVAAKLGLAPEASEPAILDAVELLNRNATSASKELLDVKAELERVKSENMDYGKQRIEAALAPLNADTIKNRVTDDQRATWRGLLEGNFDQASKALGAFIESLTPKASDTVTNRATSKQPNSQASGKEDKAVVFNRLVRDYRASHPAISFAKADAIISREHPELLAPE